MKVGDRVCVSSLEMEFMRQWREKADSAIGVIDAEASSGWPLVQFPNGYRNTYRDSDLELVDRKPLLDAAEYEEVMAAQKLMEGLGK